MKVLQSFDVKYMSINSFITFKIYTLKKFLYYTKTPSTILSRNGESGHSYAVSDFK